MARLTPTNIATLLIGIGIGAFAICWGTPDFLAAPESKAWLMTTGKIARVWEDRSQSNRNLFGAYDYEVAGEKYTSTQYKYREREFPFSTKEGQIVDVYYLPASPYVAVLNRDKPTTKFYTGLLLFGLVSVGMILSVFIPGSSSRSGS